MKKTKKPEINRLNGKTAEVMMFNNKKSYKIFSTKYTFFNVLNLI
jgi:hypothetical protein